MAARIPTLDELRPYVDVRFARGGGPGGQNVNKVNTRVTLLLDFQNCPLFTDEQRRRIGGRLGKRLSADGRLQIHSQPERSQMRNREDAEAKLIELLTQALRVDPPRRPTKPSYGSKVRRLTAKRSRAETKRERRGGWRED